MSLEKLMQRPLYVFDLPDELLTTLQFKDEQTRVASIERTDLETSADNASQPQVPSTSCSLCSLTFTSVQEQRLHVRSNLHGYNLKQKGYGRPAISEAAFEKLVDELDESISGSDSDESTEEEDGGLLDNSSKLGQDTLSLLLKKQARLHNGDAEDAPSNDRKRKRGAGTPPLFWFKSKHLPSNTSLGIYRSIFTNHEQEETSHVVESLKNKQITKMSAPKKPSGDEDEEEGGVPLSGVISHTAIRSAGPHYFLCMIGGGHFAAMLVALTPKMTKKAGITDRSATVIAHKTFHRYTTRRKQGGSQSANDNSKGNAHSAGSSLRRYNETALEMDVRNLLSDWKPWIDTAELLFIRATGTTNRRTLFGPYDAQVLSQKDNRLRGFPFNTRRATQNELMRAFVELTRVKISTVDEAALAQKAAEEDEKARQEQQRSTAKAAAAVKASKPSKEDEEAALHTTQIQALIRRSKAPGVVSYFQSNNLNPNFTFFPADKNHHAPTALHFAAANNTPALVTALLVKVGADPTIKNGEGRAAFELAGDRATRDAFSLARGQLGDEKWDWNTAGILTAISQAEVDARISEEKEQKLAEEKAEKARRQAETQRLRREDESKQNAVKDKKYGIGKVLSAPMTAEQRRMEDARGMTDEMRVRVERERRARAAEERMKRLQNGG